jgi:hypothetical protein
MMFGLCLRCGPLPLCLAHLLTREQTVGDGLSLMFVVDDWYLANHTLVRSYARTGLHMHLLL